MKPHSYNIPVCLAFFLLILPGMLIANENRPPDSFFEREDPGLNVYNGEIPDGNRIYVAPDGDNDNTGTEQEPLADLDYALGQVSTGDVIVLRGGIYEHDDRIDIEGPDGSEDQRIVVTAYPGEDGIDRYALVTRHNPELDRADKLSPLSLGNGEFAFTAGITGLQTYPEFYSREAEGDGPAPGPDGFLEHTDAEGATPLATQSQWGWHTFPNPEGYTMEDATELYDAHGREVPYASNQNTPAGEWLRENPHRLNLARIGFDLRYPDGTAVPLEDLEGTHQELELWNGALSSRFAIDGDSVDVQTWVHPDDDQLSARIDASSLESDQLGIRIAFPYGRGLHAGDPSDWSKPEAHTTREMASGDQFVTWHRILDDDEYYVHVTWDGPASITEQEKHHYLLTYSDTEEPREFTVTFSENPVERSRPDVSDTEQAASDYWTEFWKTGGAIDLSGSSAPEAEELERRIVLSQYLTAIQSSGSMPPQETGLTYNSWFGKFHLEMHWWHGVHFALWDRLPMLENSLGWYESIMPRARETAEKQGYEGVRWPKMTEPDGRDSPSSVGVFLIWQQPHPIYYAELAYREQSDEATLEQYKDMVFETAEFMASYPARVEDKDEYVLGPPLIPAQEIFPPEETYNPGFEVAYWKFGLETAQKWRERLGMARDPDWDHVLDHLPELPENDGLYVNAESAPETFEDSEQRRDHPTLLASCGLLPCDYADKEKMRQTLLRVMEDWNWDHTWGWDYPMIAMTAARVGEPEIAIEALLSDVQKNTYLTNGHNYQDTRLTLYLPGNGGLLTAVAMMAAGWENGPERDAPGFPQDDSWQVRHEGLNPMR